MDYLYVFLLTVATLYPHYRLPAFTASPAQLPTTRLILVVTGIAFGWLANTLQPEAEGLMRMLVFLSAFSVVHVPAAFILLIKGERRKP